MNKINDIYLPKNNSEEYWFKNPSILFINLDQIYPFGKLTHIYGVNLIARLALYIVFMIILLNLNKILLFLPLILFLFSYYLSLNNINQTTTASEVLYDVSGDNTISNNSNEIPVDVELYEALVCIPCDILFNTTSYSTASDIGLHVHVGLLLLVGVVGLYCSLVCVECIVASMIQIIVVVCAEVVLEMRRGGEL